MIEIKTILTVAAFLVIGGCIANLFFKARRSGGIRKTETPKEKKKNSAAPELFKIIFLPIGLVRMLKFRSNSDVYNLLSRLAFLVWCLAFALFLNEGLYIGAEKTPLKFTFGQIFFIGGACLWLFLNILSSCSPAKKPKVEQRVYVSVEFLKAHFGDLYFVHRDKVSKDNEIFSGLAGEGFNSREFEIMLLNVKNEYNAAKRELHKYRLQAASVISKKKLKELEEKQTTPVIKDADEIIQFGDFE
jgi:hypothetical protein